MSKRGAMAMVWAADPSYRVSAQFVIYVGQKLGKTYAIMNINEKGNVQWVLMQMIAWWQEIVFFVEKMSSR